MKKSLVALAVLAAAGAASAQSSVTLFGVVDASVSHYTVKSSWYNNTGFLVVPPVTVPVGVKRSQTALANSGYNSSRIGFRGTEDLGGGLAASFWLESGINNDSGSKGIDNFNRRSTVSLSGGFGEIRLGRDYTPTFWNDTVFDPFGTNGVGTNLISTINGNVAIARGAATAGNPGVIGLGGSDTYVRTSNSVGYFLPSNLGGFYGQVQYALHENVKLSDVAGSPSKKGRYVGGRFGYANGPLDVAASYGVNTASDTVVLGVASDTKIRTINVGASYDFGVVKLFGEVSRVNDKFESSGTFTNFTDNDKYTGALVGVTVPVGAGLIRAAYSRVKYKNDLGSTFVPTLFGTQDFDASANKIAIGYVHNLSKRTALYATASRIRIKDGQNNPAIMGATAGGSPTFGGTVGFNALYAPRTATGYDFGIRHSF